MRIFITLLILSWIGLSFVLGASINMPTGDLMARCVECEEKSAYHNEFIILEEDGQAYQFFYNEDETMTIKHNHHTYIPVLLEHSKKCAMCEIYQADGYGYR